MPVPLPVIPNTYRVAWKWSQGGGAQKAVNVVHMQAGASGTRASDCFEALEDAVTATMWDAIASSANIAEIDITPLDGVTATQSFVPSVPANWTGQSGGDFVPQAALLVKLSTGVRGRANRGRIYLPFIAESEMSDGAIPSAAAAGLTTIWVAFQAALIADSPVPWGLGVASYDRAHAGAGAHFTTLSGITVEQVLGTQRRRQGRLR